VIDASVAEADETGTRRRHGAADTADATHERQGA
jgi:hypothetical protein